VPAVDHVDTREIVTTVRGEGAMAWDRRRPGRDPEDAVEEMEACASR